MSEFRNWFWEIKETGQGPDYVFLASFDSADAARLADLVHEHPLPGFQCDIDAKAQSYRDCKIYDVYCDEHTYGRLKAMRATGEQKNIWYYTNIEVCDNKFSIERVLAGSVDTLQPQTETNLILMLVQSPQLTLVEWRIAYTGYSSGLINSGTSSAELLAYLTAEQ